MHTFCNNLLEMMVNGSITDKHAGWMLLWNCVIS